MNRKTPAPATAPPSEKDLLQAAVTALDRLSDFFERTEEKEKMYLSNRAIRCIREIKFIRKIK